jgi:hypothetical protein
MLHLSILAKIKIMATCFGKKYGEGSRIYNLFEEEKYQQGKFQVFSFHYGKHFGVLQRLSPFFWGMQ